MHRLVLGKELNEFLEGMTSTHKIKIKINADHECEAKEAGQMYYFTINNQLFINPSQKPRLDGGDQSDAFNC